MEAGTSLNEPFESCSVNDKGQVSLVLEEKYGVSCFYDGSNIDVWGFEGQLHKDRKRASVVDNQNTYGKKKQPIFKDYPPDLTAGTIMFFANTINMKKNIMQVSHKL